MSATMQFGPEWMRPKTQTNSRSSTREPSPPPGSSPAGTSSYSALVTPPPVPPVEVDGSSNPFKYSRDEMLRIYKEGGGKGGLGLEVERWEGVVREFGSDPVGLKEMTEADKKLFSGSLNSEMRRRQSTDYLSLNVAAGAERPKLYHGSSGAGSPMRERFGGILGRRGTADSPSLSMPRKTSLSSLNGPLASPREPAVSSPRTRTGFDGVLSSGDSWMARRRTSDASKPSGIALSKSSDGATNDDKRDQEIKEEQEEISDPGANYVGPSGGGNVNGQPVPTDPGADHSQAINQGLNNLSLGNNPNVHAAGTNGSIGHQYPTSMHAVQPPTMTPMSTAELSSIEWSYIDPSGNIQGPFRADIMQNWHDAGFFTPDLMMKRTHLDNTWMSVGDLIMRTGTSQIFLVPFPAPPAVPPGLTRRAGTTPDIHGAPFQPIPQRSLRNATLDNFLGGGSVASDSPSSSFGAGRFNNGSPDPHAFGGRAGISAAVDPMLGPRISTSAFPNVQEAVPQYGSRRGTFNDPMEAAFGGTNSPFGGPAHSPVIGGPVYHTGMDRTRTPIEGAGAFSGGFGTSSPAQVFAQPSPLATTGPAPISRHPAGSINLGGVEHVPEPSFVGPHAAAPIGQRFETNAFPSDSGLPVGPMSRDSVVPVQVEPSFQHKQPEQKPATAPQPVSTPQTESNQATEVPAGNPLASPWSNRETTSGRRVTPFDSPIPKASNIIPAESTSTKPKPTGPSHSTEPGSAPVANAWTARSQAKAARKESPWVAAMNGVVEEGWSEPHGVNKLTVNNLAQHNQQQDESPVEASPPTPAPEPVPASPVPASASATVAPIAPSEAAVGAAEPASTTKQSRRKASQATSKPTVVEAPPATVSTVEVPAPVPAPAKAPWAPADDKKAKSSTASVGFREIQEAEAKKLEVKKAAEKAVRAATAITPAEETSSFTTTSWGLPTSQTGPRTAASTAKGDTATPSAPGAATPATPPVWTAAAKPATGKKTMKEIQEEEERRKKQAVKEKENATAAARRAYAESTTKPSVPTPAPAPSVGGAWTTVGAGGKTGSPAVTTTRPTAASIAAAATPATVPPAPARAANGAPRPTAATATAPTAAAAVTSKRENTPAAKADELPSPPSQEFLKWLGEALKGLNSSVNFEEIAAMLLSFPPDDPSTAEIISDLIYANSTTLDGRRFASEFVTKRAADATARNSKGGSTRPMAPTSIADVVRSQPKPAAQNEWGGFKVVNKKKKGGRA